MNGGVEGKKKYRSEWGRMKHYVAFFGFVGLQ